MEGLEKSFAELVQACANLGVSLRKWVEENIKIIAGILPIITNNGRKRYGLPMKRNQAIKRAKKNRRKRGAE